MSTLQSRQTIFHYTQICTCIMILQSKRLCLLTLFLCILFLNNFVALAQEKKSADSPVYDFDLSITKGLSEDLDESIFTAIQEETNYALIIGVGDYKDENIQDLNKPVEDASDFIKVLEDLYTYESDHSVLLKNPTRSQIIAELENLTKKVSPRDNLLIFYAGHGIWDENLKAGYWLPSDATQSDKSTWLANSQLREYVKGINSRHTLLIADACFSGAIFDTRSAGFDPGDLGEDDQDKIQANKVLYSKKSRQAMTSGVLTEVPDESTFLQVLIQGLKRNREPMLQAGNFFYSYLQKTVINSQENSQVPDFGVIIGTDDQGGDFFFIRKK